MSCDIKAGDKVILDGEGVVKVIRVDTELQSIPAILCLKKNGDKSWYSRPSFSTKLDLERLCRFDELKELNEEKK